MSMSMRDTIQNDKAKEDIKAFMKSALKKPNAAVGQSGLQVIALIQTLRAQNPTQIQMLKSHKLEFEEQSKDTM